MDKSIGKSFHEVSDADSDNEDRIFFVCVLVSIVLGTCLAVCFTSFLLTGLLPWQDPTKLPSLSPQFKAEAIRAVEAIATYHFQRGKPDPPLPETMENLGKVAESTPEQDAYLFIKNEFLSVSEGLGDDRVDERSACAGQLVSVITGGRWYFPKGIYHSNEILYCGYLEFSEYNPYFYERVNRDAHF